MQIRTEAARTEHGNRQQQNSKATMTRLRAAYNEESEGKKQQDRMKQSKGKKAFIAKKKKTYPDPDHALSFLIMSCSLAVWVPAASS